MTVANQNLLKTELLKGAQMLLEEFSILTYSEGGVADLVGHNRAALRSGLQKCHFRTARNVRIDRENVLHAEHKRDPIRAWRTDFFSVWCSDPNKQNTG